MRDRDLRPVLAVHSPLLLVPCILWSLRNKGLKKVELRSGRASRSRCRVLREKLSDHIDKYMYIYMPATSAATSPFPPPYLPPRPDSKDSYAHLTPCSGFLFVILRRSEPAFQWLAQTLVSNAAAIASRAPEGARAEVVKKAPEHLPTVL